MTTPSPAPHLGNPLGDPADQPGTKAYVEKHHGPQASFGQRVVAQLIDGALALPIFLIPFAIGMALLVMGLPDTYYCYDGDDYSCTVPGTGNALLVILAILLFVLAMIASLAFQVWNEAVRVSRTGRSVGRQIVGLTVINARTGERLQLVPALLKALVSQFAGLISALWMIFDDDDRTLSDKVGEAAVIQSRPDETSRGGAA